MLSFDTKYKSSFISFSDNFKLTNKPESVRMATNESTALNEENLKKAEELKGQANEYFKTEKYPQAIELYTQCIQLNPNHAVYFANRSIAYLRFVNYLSLLQKIFFLLQDRMFWICSG